MFNILLDELPEERNGYRLNTDFRVGIQIAQASEDVNLTEYEKLQIFASLLFYEECPPDAEEVYQILEWFLNSWQTDKFTDSGSSVKAMDFDADQGRIYSAFLMQYHIDLNTEDMHFWKFMFLLSNLEECSFTRVIDIRTKKIDKRMSKEEQTLYAKAKKVYALEEMRSDDEIEAEQEATEQFLKLLGAK